jgi:hypothetical protein
VTSVSASKIQPVFNLEVGDNQTYFVGDTGLLVHDNSEAQRVTRPFDEIANVALAVTHENPDSE